MHAVIVTGGQQYRVEKGQHLRVQKLEYEAGSEIELDKVLLVTNGDKASVGKPYVTGAKVFASVVEHGRGKKIKIIKFRRRKHSRTQQGHRQGYTTLKITDIKTVDEQQ